MDSRAALHRLETAFSTLRPDTVGVIRELYADHAWFKDPFNEVHDSAAIERIFAHMFEQLVEPRFVIVERTLEGRDAWLAWNLDYRVRAAGPQRRIHGASHLVFGEDGRVLRHRDYWDTAEELYESVPLLGSVLRMIKSRLRAS